MRSQDSRQIAARPFRSLVMYVCQTIGGIPAHSAQPRGRFLLVVGNEFIEEVAGVVFMQSVGDRQIQHIHDPVQKVIAWEFGYKFLRSARGAVLAWSRTESSHLNG